MASNREGPVLPNIGQGMQSFFPPPIDLAEDKCLDVFGLRKTNQQASLGLPDRVGFPGKE